MIDDGPCSPLICAADLPASGDCIDQVTLTAIEEAIDEASYIIYRMSGRRVYGLCTSTVRPLVRNHDYTGSCESHCTVASVRLGERVQSIQWVMIDGEVLQPSEYRLAMGDRLVRTGGLRWPHCQDRTKGLDQLGTWGIRYTHGMPVDAVTKRAVIDTTMELVKLAVPGSKDRKLPSNTTSVRQSGVSLTMADRAQLTRELGSYLESVARFQAIHGANGNPGTFVYSPDTSAHLEVNLPDFG